MTGLTLTPDCLGTAKTIIEAYSDDWLEAAKKKDELRAAQIIGNLEVIKILVKNTEEMIAPRNSPRQKSRSGVLGGRKKK